ncbi:hypothetical protein [Clostridium sp. LP20]|uniref:hypothetical protein n=1 Tax=Clostridium sp. LP20 TaxID=3418665 RepID=UPI003EE6A1A5
MKNKKKLLIIILSIFLILSAGGNIYQWIKVGKYKENLTASIKQNLYYFSENCGNSSIDSSVYTRMVSSIESARNSYIILNDGDSSIIGGYNDELAKLLTYLTMLTRDEKKRFEEFISKQEMNELIFDISRNLEDRDSISKVIDLLNVVLGKSHF